MASRKQRVKNAAGQAQRLANTFTKRNQKRETRHRKTVNAIYDPLNFNLTPKQVRAAVTGAINTRYGGQLGDLNDQITAAKQTNQDINGWYQNYLNALQSARDNTAAYYQGMQDAHAQIQAPAPTGDAVADQAARGRAALGNAFQGAMNTMGGNNVANFNNQMANEPLMVAGSHLAQNRVIGQLKSQRGELKGEMGDYGNTYLMDLRDRVGQNLLAAKAFNLDVTQEKNRHDETVAGNKLAYKQLKANNQKAAETFLADHGVSQKQWNNWTPKQRAEWNRYWNKKSPSASDKKNKYTLNYLKQHGYLPPSYKDLHPTKTAASNGKDKYGNTKTQRRTNNNAWNSAKEYLNEGGVKGVTVNDIQTDAKVPYDVAQIAQYWGTHGHRVTKQQAARLRRLGIKVVKGHIETGKHSHNPNHGTGNGTSPQGPSGNGMP